MPQLFQQFRTRYRVSRGIKLSVGFLSETYVLKKQAIHFFQTAKTVLNVTKSFILSLQHHRGKHVWCEIKSTLIVFIPFQQHRNQRVVRRSRYSENGTLSRKRKDSFVCLLKAGRVGEGIISICIL